MKAYDKYFKVSVDLTMNLTSDGSDGFPGHSFITKITNP